MECGTNILLYFSGRYVCIIVWPDGAQGGSAYDLGYNLVFFALSYIFPMILMTFSYVRIYIALNKKLNVEVQSSALLKSIEMKQKVRGWQISLVTMLQSIHLIIAFRW